MKSTGAKSASDLAKKYLPHKYSPIKKIRVIIEGLKFAFLYDFSFAYKVPIALIATLLSLFFNDYLNVFIILILTVQTLSMELMNSAVEQLCNFVEPNANQRIKVIKDISSAATGLCIGLWTIVLIWEYFQLILRFF
jgi:diacylglycerol kinase (ATP)